MSDSDTNDDDIPSAEVCNDRCKQFAEITSTDTVLAMFYLQDKKWDLQLALNEYYQANGKKKTAEPSVALVDNAVDSTPNRVKLLSWNVDGLDATSLQTRTKGVCHTILSEAPDVVFLQEVVPPTVAALEAVCGASYKLVTASEDGYFTAMLLKRSSVSCESHDVAPFYSSKMGRSLLMAHVKVKDVACFLMTSHLESTAAHKGERKKQLQAAFKRMHEAAPRLTVLFGGDFNLRDKELDEIGGLPTNISDVWLTTGSRPIAQYTWDAARNDNINMPPGARPRCRFDRLYMRRPAELKPVYFELCGLQRLPGCRRFPSDHWAILAHFDIVRGQ